MSVNVRICLNMSVYVHICPYVLREYLLTWNFINLGVAWVFCNVNIFYYSGPSKLFLSVGSPLRENPFSESWLVWRVLSVCGVSPSGESIFRILTFLKSSFCLRGLPFGGIHFQNPDFCLGNLAVIRAGGTCCPHLGERPGATASHCPLRYWVRTLIGKPS